MHYTIDYSKSPSPNFDAVNDVMEYLGKDRNGALSSVVA